MKKIVFLIFVVLLCAMSSFPQGALREIFKRIDGHQKALQSLRAKITIESAASKSGEKSVKTGVLMFMPTKDGYLMRIDVTSPLPEAFLVAKNQYVLYLPETSPVFLPGFKPAYTGAVTDAQRDLLFLPTVLPYLVGEKWKLEYAVKYTGEETLSNSTRVWHLELDPKKPNKTFFDLWVDGNGMPVQWKFGKNNATIVRLSNLEKNVSLKAREFQIELPKGVKVISN